MYGASANLLVVATSGAILTAQANCVAVHYGAIEGSLGVKTGSVRCPSVQSSKVWSKRKFAWLVARLGKPSFAKPQLCSEQS